MAVCRRSRFSHVCCALLLGVSPVVSQNLTGDQLAVVKTRLAEGATHSWELGTRAQALTEYDAPSYSVLNSSSLPPPLSTAPSSLGDVLSIAHSVVANRSLTDNNVVGPQPLMTVAGGAAGDPPSIGVSVLLANWTGMGAQDGQDYAGAARDQLNYLLQDVPRTTDGAISHRVEQVQLWSDFVYMVPPFLAYYGVLSANQSLVMEAYTQVKLYRQYLLDSGAGGLWKHIVLGNYSDDGHWSTGNGWAAAGMLRVLGTIQHSQYSARMKSEMKDLAAWVAEIQTGMYAHLQSNGLFKNYADSNSSFDDASSTALLASTVYRLVLLTGTSTYLPLAELSRIALSTPGSASNSTSSPSSSLPSSPSSDTSSQRAASTSTSPSTSTAAVSSTTAAPTPTQSLAHFTGDMWLTPVVNPESFGSEGSESPEAQAFVIEMYAAWRDWVALGSPTTNAVGRLRAATWASVLAAAIAGGFGIW